MLIALVLETAMWNRSCDVEVHPASSLLHDARDSTCSSVLFLHMEGGEMIVAPGIGLAALLRENISAIGSGTGGTGGIISFPCLFSVSPVSLGGFDDRRKKDRLLMSFRGLLTGEGCVERDEVEYTELDFVAGTDFREICDEAFEFGRLDLRCRSKRKPTSLGKTTQS